MGLFAGAGNAGEEAVMAMRGNPPDGIRPQNMLLNMVWTGGVGEVKAHAPTAKVAPRVEEPAGLGREARPEEYLRWRDNCVRTPLLVAGQSLELDCSVGFDLTPRFVRAGGDGSAGFFEVLAKELAAD